VQEFIQGNGSFEAFHSSQRLEQLECCTKLAYKSEKHNDYTLVCSI